MSVRMSGMLKMQQSDPGILESLRRYAAGTSVLADQRRTFRQPGASFTRAEGDRRYTYTWLVPLGYTVVFICPSRLQFSGSSCTTMAAPNISSDGLQIAQPETYPEAVHRLSTNNDTKLPQFHDHSHQEIAQTRGRRSYERSFFEPGPRSVQSEFGPNIEVPVDVWKKVFHDRRRKFWWIVVLSIVIVGALIGGSIGGALFVQNKADEYVRLVRLCSWFCS
jgi:hypothetical protein